MCQNKARTDPPRTQMWPQRRWRRKWSGIIDSLIRNLIKPGHVPKQGQDRPAQDPGPLRKSTLTIHCKKHASRRVGAKRPQSDEGSLNPSESRPSRSIVKNRPRGGSAPNGRRVTQVTKKARPRQSQKKASAKSPSKNGASFSL